MESLIHDLLELARIGEPGERPALVDPREVLLQLARRAQAAARGGRHRARAAREPRPRVFCDRSRLYQVFSNLIGNAIDHMGAAPRCAHRGAASTRTTDGTRSSWRDNGRGIDPAHHERIFEVVPEHRHARATAAAARAWGSRS